jgi:hypothetical protein
MDVRPARPMPGAADAIKAIERGLVGRMISETLRGRDQTRKILLCKSYNRRTFRTETGRVTFMRYRVFTLLAYARRGAEAS